MKLAARSLLLFTALGATIASAQTQTHNIPQIQHVIVVVQENRTPDNLFGSDAFNSQPQLPGADLVQTGLCSQSQNPITLQSIMLGDHCDPSHGHKHSWVPTYNSGNMNGACTIGMQGCTKSDPEYTYVDETEADPYFQIAKQYGYANYMFQTSQGPSFPAHQFLLSGTSAPDYFGDTNSNCGTEDPDCWHWFAAENANVRGAPYGCTATSTVVMEIDSAGNESNGYLNGYPCYTHNTLATLLDNNKITWKYYAHAASLQPSNPATSLWTAPNAISGICVPVPVPGGSVACTGGEWNSNVVAVFPYASNYPNSYSPILTDLGVDPNQPQCSLPAVSWVVPDGAWSDHGGEDTNNGGPDWVTAIVNAVGGGYTNKGKQLKDCGYWKNTVILITWDDWGGWYDHILPLNCGPGPNGTCSGYPNSTGNWYVYGFRVPLLVVSAYNVHGTGSYKGYISGACYPPNCPNKQPPYVHDFGSILNFIEYAFGQNGKPLGGTGGISPSYPYADWYAPDGPFVCGAKCAQPYSLGDFFNFGNQATTFTPFTITNGYGTECFIVPSGTGCFGSNFTPSDPDDDNVDVQD